MPVMGLSPDQERYARHTLLPGWDQGRLSGSTAVVLGVGALGNTVAECLALAGIGRLILCDPDRIEASNLSRAPLFRASQVGRLKVEAAADTLAELAPEVRVEARPFRLEHGVGLGELRRASVVVGCLDSHAARLELAGRCGLARAPWLDGATGPWDGEVRLYLDPEGPCYGCSHGPEPAFATRPPLSCGLPPEETGPAGAAAPISAVIGAHMALAAVRFCLGLPCGTGLRNLDGAASALTPVQQARSPLCPLHQPLPEAHPLPLDTTASIADLLAAVRAVFGPGAEPLSWYPVVIARHCPTCNHYDPRPAAADSPALCPHCATPLRRRTTQDLTTLPPATRLDEIGVPPGEVLGVRVGGGMGFVELRH